MTSLLATAKPVVHSEAVRAEFAAAGIPDDVASKVLQQYSCYLGWDTDTKLRPALQLWLKQLGCQQLSERLDKYPQLLIRTPQECNHVYLWLASLGVDAERIQQKVPAVMGRHLSDVQSTVHTIQNALELTAKQLPAYFKRHHYSLQFSSDHVAQTLQTAAELLAVPVASKEMQEVVLVSGQQLFRKDPAVIHERTSFFCKEFQGGKHATKTALKQNIYEISVGTMRERAAEVKAMLGWTEAECNHALNAYPRILTYQPSTVANNMQKLQANNFSSAQALNICASRPALACYDWSSPSNVEKLLYLMLFLQVSPAEIVSKPVMLTYSLERRMGPRCKFMYRSRAITPDTPLALSRCSGCLTLTNADFAVKFNNPLASPPLVYDESFKQHWQNRWKFLRRDMGLSIADISACRELSYRYLPNTLAPQWCLLTRLEAAQKDFRAADHLMAVATLSDELFTDSFDIGSDIEEGFHVA